LKVKHSCVELSLLTKRGLLTLNFQIPCYTKNFDERNQRSSKWYSLLSNTDESWWRLWPICWV